MGPAAETGPIIIPRAALFGNPARTQARLSPDGAWITFLQPLDDYLNVWVMPRAGADHAKARVITKDRNRGIYWHKWAEDSRHILYLQDRNGDENWRLFAVDVSTGETRDLTPLEGVQARPLGSSASEPNIILVGINDRDARWHDVYRINIETGARTLVYKNVDQFSDFFVDQQNRLRLASRTIEMGPRAGGVEYLALRGVAWRRFLETRFEDSVSSYPIAFEGNGDSFLMIDSTGRDKAALVRVSMESGAREVLGESPLADVSQVWLNPETNAPEAFGAEYLKLEWTGLDQASRDALQRLKEDLANANRGADARPLGEPDVVARSRDNRFWIVVEDGPQVPARSWLYDRSAPREQAMTLLFAQRPLLDGAPLRPLFPVEIASRDGQRLVSYLTLPADADPDGDGQANTPAPLVLVVHGGPWARDSFGYRPDHQWLANRGYAVLSVNFRGSTGFGKAFINLGNREWGAKMQDDLIDAANWAVARGVTSANTIAIYGGSYGGYAALAGLAFTPDRFACGVSIVGPSNLVTLLQSTPPEWESLRALFRMRVGDVTSAEGRAFLESRSPLTRADDIRRPLLIVHGANDRRVGQSESEQIVSAMRARDLPVTYLLYPDEGHGLKRPQNRTSFHAISESFLQSCLGGRIEPIGRDLDGASLEVRAGADFVPGLKAAIPARPDNRLVEQK